ncbi:MAG: 50S ribosomal protein L21 [Pseudomonadota bacterium]
MYAVVKTGGKQYRVAKDDIIKVEKLAGDDGETVVLDEVLMVANGGDVTVGAPLVDGASVAAEILEQGRAKKIIVFKKRRRQNYRRKKGHRQHLTVLRVTDILTGGAKPSAVKKTAKPAPAESAAAPAPAAEVASAAETAPMTYEARPDNADDLKLISGVGPKLEETLNDLGFYTFEQIAGWTPENVAYVDARLKFKGRIERDDWITKAKDLAAQK